MTEISDEEAHQIAECVRDRKRFMADMEWYREQGHSYRDFELNIYALFRKCGVAAAETVEAGIEAVKAIVRWNVWWAGVLQTQSGWLTKLVGLAIFVAAILVCAAIVSSNWTSIMAALAQGR